MRHRRCLVVPCRISESPRRAPRRRSPSPRRPVHSTSVIPREPWRRTIDMNRMRERILGVRPRPSGFPRTCWMHSWSCTGYEPTSPSSTSGCRGRWSRCPAGVTPRRTGDPSSAADPTRPAGAKMKNSRWTRCGRGRWSRSSPCSSTRAGRPATPPSPPAPPSSTPTNIRQLRNATTSPARERRRRGAPIVRSQGDLRRRRRTQRCCIRSGAGFGASYPYAKRRAPRPCASGLRGNEGWLGPAASDSFPQEHDDQSADQRGQQLSLVEGALSDR